MKDYKDYIILTKISRLVFLLIKGVFILAVLFLLTLVLMINYERFALGMLNLVVLSNAILSVLEVIWLRLETAKARSIKKHVIKVITKKTEIPSIKGALTVEQITDDTFKVIIHTKNADSFICEVEKNMEVLEKNIKCIEGKDVNIICEELPKNK